MSPVADVIAPEVTITPRFCWEPVPEVPSTVIVPVPVEEIVLESTRTPSFPVPVEAVEPVPVTLILAVPVEVMAPPEDICTP